MLAQLGSTHHPRYASQGSQVLGVSVARREQGDQKIDGLVVYRIERHRRLQAYENRADTIQAVDPGVGNSHTLTNAGGAGGLALEQAVEDGGGVNAEHPRGDVGDHAENLPLAWSADAQRHRSRIQKIAYSHGLNRSLAVATATPSLGAVQNVQDPDRIP